MSQRSGWIIGLVSAISFWAAIIAATTVAMTSDAHAQSSSCQATSAAPTYAPGLRQLSCDLAGNLRTLGSGGGSTTQDTNLIEIGGVPVATTVPGSLDIVCVSGCVGGSGVSQGTATTAAPTYIDATNNPLSLDLAGNLRVLVGNASIAVTQSGTWNIGTVTAVTAITNALPAGNNNIGDVDAIQSGAWNIGTVTAVTAITNALPAGNNNIGDVDIASAIPAGNNNIGDVDAIQSGTWTVQPGNTPNTTPWLYTPVPATTQADTLSSSAILANSTNATLVKNSAGTLFEISVYNESAKLAWLKFYNSGTIPTCGSGTPVARYLIPASTAGAGSNVNIALGKEFTAGIGYCVTGVITDADTTAVTANDFVVNLTYK